MNATADAIEAASEQLTLVRGVLLEARDLHDRVNQALQALEYAKAALNEARQTTEGGA